MFDNHEADKTFPQGVGNLSAPWQTETLTAPAAILQGLQLIIKSFTSDGRVEVTLNTPEQNANSKYWTTGACQKNKLQAC